jgi:hypothetical protein
MPTPEEVKRFYINHPAPALVEVNDRHANCSNWIGRLTISGFLMAKPGYNTAFPLMLALSPQVGSDAYVFWGSVPNNHPKQFLDLWSKNYNIFGEAAWKSPWAPDERLVAEALFTELPLKDQVRVIGSLPPTDLSRFPHRCGCGSPAYIGAVPAAAECSSPKCRYYRG